MFGLKKVKFPRGIKIGSFRRKISESHKPTCYNDDQSSETRKEEIVLFESKDEEVVSSKTEEEEVVSIEPEEEEVVPFEIKKKNVRETLKELSKNFLISLEVGTHASCILAREEKMACRGGEPTTHTDNLYFALKIGDNEFISYISSMVQSADSNEITDIRDNVRDIVEGVDPAAPTSLGNVRRNLSNSNEENPIVLYLAGIACPATFNRIRMLIQSYLQKDDHVVTIIDGLSKVGLFAIEIAPSIITVTVSIRIVTDVFSWWKEEISTSTLLAGISGAVLGGYIGCRVAGIPGLAVGAAIGHITIRSTCKWLFDGPKNDAPSKAYRLLEIPPNSTSSMIETAYEARKGGFYNENREYVTAEAVDYAVSIIKASREAKDIMQ